MACPKLLGQIVVDVLSYVLAIVPTVSLNKIGRPFQRGFFCDDSSITLPYKTNTISGRTLMCGILLIPAGLIIIVETIHYILEKRSSKASSSTSYKVTNKCSIPIVVVRFYKVFGVFLFGAAVTMAMTDVGKYTVGRLRPHFLSICQPNHEALRNCTSSVYIEANTCTRKSDWMMLNSRLSFPSGHASIAMYGAAFLILYLQQRMTWKFSRLAKPCLQGILAFIATYVTLTRVSDYAHHWSDVLAGAALGGFVGAVMELYVLRRAKNRKSNQESQLPYLVVNSDDSKSADTRI